MDPFEWGRSAVLWANSLLTWMESHSNYAAWVQAIGSIMALVVAIWIANGQARQVRSERRTERANFIRTAAGIAEDAIKLVDGALDAAENGATGYLLEVHNQRQFDDMEDLLRQLSVQQMVSSRFNLGLLELRRALLSADRLVHGAAEDEHEHGAVDPDTAEYVQRIKQSADAAMRVLRSERNRANLARY